MEMETERSPQWDYHETKRNKKKKWKKSIESAKMTAYTNSFNDSQWVFSMRFTFDLMPFSLSLSLSAFVLDDLLFLFYFFFHPRHVHRMLMRIRTFNVLYCGTNCASKLNHLLCMCTVWLYAQLICAHEYCASIFISMFSMAPYAFWPFDLFDTDQKLFILFLIVDVIRVARLRFNASCFCWYYFVISSKFSIHFWSYISVCAQCRVCLLVYMIF